MKLKPCPFCGYPAEITGDGLTAYCTNAKCDATISRSYNTSKERVSTTWNRRTPSPRQEALEGVASLLRDHITNGTLKCASCKKVLADLDALEGK